MYMTFVRLSVRDEFTTPDTSEVEIYLRIVDAFQLITFVTNSTVLVAERIQYPPLLSAVLSSSIFRHKSSLVWEKKTAHFGILLVYIYVSHNLAPSAP